MSLFRLIIGITAIVAAVLFAQSPSQTRAREQSLRNSLFTLRQAIDTYTYEQHKSPRTLQDLVAKGLLKSIPADPMTQSNRTWRIVMEEPAKSVDPKAPGIFDVKSGSDSTGSDGTRYADW